MGQGPKVSRRANLVGIIPDSRHRVALTVFSVGPEAAALIESLVLLLKSRAKIEPHR
jgi:hypothetical protein